MFDLRNPFAIRNGKVILIEDLSVNERGLNCRCQCPACDGDFIARMGDIKVHHFAHSKDACDETIAYTSGLYKLIHQILKDGTEFYVPSLVVSCQLPKNKVLNEDTIEQFVKIVNENSDAPNKKVVSKGKSISFDNAELFFDNKKQIQAIELSCRGKKMAIKIMPPDTVCQHTTVSPHKDMATLVLDFEDDAEKIHTFKSEDFQQYFLSKNLYKYWISNPLKKTLYPQLLEKNKNDYGAYLEQQKRLEEERKYDAVKAEEARKIEEEEQKQLCEKRRMEAFEQQKRLKEEKQIAEQRKVTKQKAKDILAYESVKDKFTQQTDRVVDVYGNRWIQCEECGEIKKESTFWTYGGHNRINLGQCYDCRKGERN